MPDIHAQRKDGVEHSEKAAIDKSERTQKSDLPITWSWASSLQNSEKISFCYLSHAVFSGLYI